MTTPSDLTDRQREVAALVAQGRTCKRIAFQLGVSLNRVYVLRASVAFAIGCPPEDDENVFIALWWRSNHLDPAA